MTSAILSNHCDVSSWLSETILKDTKNSDKHWWGSGGIFVVVDAVVIVIVVVMIVNVSECVLKLLKVVNYL